MLERELPQISSGEADKLIDEAAEFLVEFMTEFNATHEDPDAREFWFAPDLRLVHDPVHGRIVPYFEELCALTLAREYVIVPDRDEQSDVSPSSTAPAGSQMGQPKERAGAK
jgi:hypothetical protein